ncbi:MAG TPA: hypothetical protein ENH99_01410 [Candidatus Pacearchaeota archaeon]|nr:hypothetical protein [Candidatus Pacearchaeota archaeon]
MNRLKIFNKNEKIEFEKELEKQFGIKSVPGLILRRGEERLFLFSGSFNIRQLKKLEEWVPVERVGVYFAKQAEGGIRLSIEGTQILKDQIKKNIFELNNEQTEEWMMGRELPIKTGKREFLIMKHKNEFMGTGKASAEKIGNYIPKSRRLKNRER